MSTQKTKTAVINVKVDAKVKKDASQLADDLGISISLVVQGFLRQFVHNKGISFFTFEKTQSELHPTPRLLRAVRQVKKTKKNAHSFSFDDSRQAVQFLRDVRNKKVRV